uniref:Ribonuclease H-like domain-containing protein n=1 Tax=Tanacetum cinerariifolium TaxID=118510 RepID=A0A699H0B8_TANCI|nr:ribonuclease H-like domain-containing protein [Tanacetum cinerariifolium]
MFAYGTWSECKSNASNLSPLAPDQILKLKQLIVLTLAETNKGVEKQYPPTTVEERLARRNELKARGTLLMALPNEHQLKFNSYKTAKSLMEAIEKIFGDNKESKKVQKTLLTQQYENFSRTSSEGLDQTYDRLQKLINLKTLSMDELYNNLKIYEAEVMSAAHGVSAANSKTSASNLPNVDSLRDRLKVAYGNVDYEIYEIPIEDRKESRAPKQQDNRNKEVPRRTVPVEDTTSNALVSQCDGLGYDWSDHAEKGPIYFALIAYTSSSFSSTSNSDTESPAIAKSNVKTVESKLNTVSEAIIEDWVFNSEEENETKTKSKHTKPSFAKVNFVKLNDQVKTPRESVKHEDKYRQAKYPRKHSQSPRGNQRNWNNLMTQRLGDNFKFKNKACYKCGSFGHLLKDCKTYKKKMVEKPVWNNARRVNHHNSQRLSHPHSKINIVPKAVLTTSGLKTLNIAKQNSSRATILVNTTRSNNTSSTRSTVNGAKPISNVFHKSHSLIKRTFNQRTTPKNSDLKETVNAVKHARFEDQQEMILIISPKTMDHTCLKDLTMLIFKANSESEEFGQIVDFLNANPIKYALTRKQKSRRKQRKETEVFHDKPQTEEHVPTPSHDPPPSGEDSMQLSKLIVKKLKSKMKKSIHRLKRLYKVRLSARVESSEDVEASLGDQEDASKQKRSIDDIDQDEGTTLVNDQDMFGVNDLNGDEVVMDATTSENVEQNVKRRTTPTPQPSKAKDKGKAIMIEPENPLKKKDQIAHDEEVTRELEAQLKAKMEEEERLAKEKHKANIDFKGKSFDTIKKMFDKAYKRVNTFVAMDAEVTKGSSNRAIESSKRSGEELESDKSKKQKLDEHVQAKVDEDNSTELQRCLEIVQDDGDDVLVDAIPLSFKSPTIINYKNYREGKKHYF